MRRPRNAASAAALATPVGGAAGGVGVGVNVGSVLAVVLSVSVWLRATRNAAMQSTHPDEVYQGIEQAHVLAHGYGMVPFEYTRDAALRSHALPLVYAAVMRVCDTLGLDYHQYSLPATRLLHHILTGVLVPLAGYAVARAHGGSRAAACGAAGVLAVNDYIVGVGSQTLSSGLTGAAIMLVASALSRASRGGRPSTTVPRLATELSAGLVVGCMAYVRPDSAILAAALLLVSPTSWVCSAVAAMARARQLLAIGAGAAVAAAGGAALDSFMYGRATFSPFNWFRYNILDAKSQVHGVSAQTFYVEHLLPLRNPLVWVVLGAAVAECARLCLWHPTCPRRDDPRTGTAAPGSADGEGATPAPAQDENNDQTQRDKSTTLGAFTSLKSVSAPANGGERATTALRGPTGHSDGAPPLLLLAQALAVGAVFSLVPHKEVRFVHDAYALLVVFAVVVLVRLCDEVLLPRVEWVAQEPRRTWALMATAAVSVRHTYCARGTRCHVAPLSTDSRLICCGCVCHALVRPSLVCLRLSDGSRAPGWISETCTCRSPATLHPTMCCATSEASRTVRASLSWRRGTAPVVGRRCTRK